MEETNKFILMKTLEERMNIIACRLRASNYSDDYIDAFLVGYAEGRAEERDKLVRGFKDAGTPIEVIAQVTGLSIEEIQKL